DGTRDGAGERRRDGVPRVPNAGDAPERVLSSASDRSRRLRRAGFRGGRTRDRRDRAKRARVEDQPGARRPGASRHAACDAGRVGTGRRQGGGRGLRRRGSPARARRHGVRGRGERDPGMARPAGSDVERRRRSDRRASARTRDAAVTPSPARQAADVAAAAQLACLLEASAPKPGNVSPFASFRDATYEDFLASAAAIGPAFAAAGEQSLGTTIREAMEATSRWATSNTNLGLVLLLAPLARAALRPGREALRVQLAATLAHTTVGDARDAYVAIRSVAPGGLGQAGEQDVADTPTKTLRDVMALARDRDAIAREYATDFATTFEIGAPALRRELRDEANTLNPGATADLTGAAIYVLLLEGGWRGRP